MNGAARGCQAAETAPRRALRLVCSSLLLLIAVAECGMACLLVASAFTPSRSVLLLSTLTLFATAVITLRSVENRVLLVAQSAAAVALLSLFRTGRPGQPGPLITVGQFVYDPTLSLAGLLFAAILLARLLRGNPNDAGCNCH